MRVNKTLDWIGRILIHAGILVLLFVSYQLWGTGLIERRAQNQLEDQFDTYLKAPETTTTTTTPPTTEAVPPGKTPPPPVQNVAQGPPPPPSGNAVAHIRIQSAGVDKIVVQGVGVPDLKKGPGHYPKTPLPGQPGNSAIAGHRTTYGAPFNRLDQVKNGDHIFVTTKQGQFEYVVFEKKIVKPKDVSVLKDFGDNRLTLTTCNPKYSATTRLVVISKLIGTASPLSPYPDENITATTTPTTAATDTPVVNETTTTTAPTAPVNESGLSGDTQPIAPAILWGIIVLVVYFGMRIAMIRWRFWAALIIGVPILSIALFIFFENFSRLLPANV